MLEVLSNIFEETINILLHTNNYINLGSHQG